MPAGRSIGLLECFEDDLLFLSRDADARIASPRRPPRLRPGSSVSVSDRPAFEAPGTISSDNFAVFGEFERVRKQVLQHLLQPLVSV